MKPFAEYGFVDQSSCRNVAGTCRANVQCNWCLRPQLLSAVRGSALDWSAGRPFIVRRGISSENHSVVWCQLSEDVVKDNW